MVLIGSSTATAAHYAVKDLPVPLLPVIRFGGTGLALLPLLWGSGALVRLVRDDAPALFAASLLAVPVNQGFFLNASRLTPTTHVGLIYATCPLVVLTLAVLMRHERLEPARLLGVFISVVGTGVIALATLTQQGPKGSATVSGDLLLVGAVTSWGGYLTINKRLIVRHSALAVLVATCLLGALLSLPLALWSTPEWPARFAMARPVSWWSLAYLTVVASLLGLACQNLALRHFDASHVATVGNLSPVLTVLWGVWLLNESLTPSLVLGGCLTLAGIVLASRPTVPAHETVRPSRVLEPRSEPQRVA
jgi:drug/metabolite transporter (DMT)-like permease